MVYSSGTYVAIRYALLPGDQILGPATFANRGITCLQRCTDILLNRELSTICTRYRPDLGSCTTLLLPSDKKDSRDVALGALNRPSREIVAALVVGATDLWLVLGAAAAVFVT
jgi:hypothetical protein